MPLQALDVVTQAAQEAGILGAGETLNADDSTFILSKLNRLIDNWNAERAAIYSSQFVTNPLTPNLQPHTIGPTGTFVVTQRPVSIDGGNVLLVNGSQTTKSPLTIRDDAWWLAQTAPSITGPLPTDLYYSADWANGSCYFWPVPTVAYQVELMVRLVLAQYALTDTFSMPPGYWDALVLTLAEDIAPAFDQLVLPQTSDKARQARARIFNNNDDIPRISTRDAGMPSGNDRRPTFNWRSGI